MAGLVLPTELQDENGNIIYPHTEADVVFTTEGETVEEALEKKTQVVITSENIPVEQREKGAMYLIKKSGGTQVPTAQNIVASPYVGYSIL